MHFTRRVAVVESGGTLEYYQNLDVRMAVQFRSVAWTGIDKDHTDVRTTLVCADELVREGVNG